MVFVFCFIKENNILKKSPGTNHCLPDENNFISLAEKAFYYDTSHHDAPQKANQGLSLSKVNLEEADQNLL